MFNAWFYLMLAVALVDWYAVYHKMEQVRFITKPAVLSLLIVWFLTSGGLRGAGGLFLVALLFSLLGDILLLNGMVRRWGSFFQLGLLAFLVTQILYIITFNRPASSISPFAVAILGAVGLVGFFNARAVLPIMQAKAEGRAMVPPVVVYMVALSLMLASALAALPRPDWQPAPALLLALGAGLFYLSDSLIAHNTFVREIRGADLVLTITYHLGQFAIVAAMLSNAQ